MKKIMIIGVLCVMACVVTVAFADNSDVGSNVCASADEAIGNAADKTSAEQVVYLLGQAEAFYNSDKFQQAVDVAQYILSNLDKDNASAKELVSKAQSMLKEQAGKAIGDISAKIGGM